MSSPDDRMNKEENTLRVLTPADAVRAAAEALAAARVEFAETFIRAIAASAKPITDRQASELTVAATHDEITTLRAELDIALWLMRKS